MQLYDCNPFIFFSEFHSSLNSQADKQRKGLSMFKRLTSVISSSLKFDKLKPQNNIFPMIFLLGRRLLKNTHLEFSVTRVTRVKLSFKLQQRFPATFLETCQLVVLLFINWWNCVCVSKTILKEKKSNMVYNLQTS